MIARWAKVTITGLSLSVTWVTSLLSMKVRASTAVKLNSKQIVFANLNILTLYGSNLIWIFSVCGIERFRSVHLSCSCQEKSSHVPCLPREWSAYDSIDYGKREEKKPFAVGSCPFQRKSMRMANICVTDDVGRNQARADMVRGTFRCLLGQYSWLTMCKSHSYCLW